KKRGWCGVAFYPGRRPRRPCPGLLSCRPSRGFGGHMNGWRLRRFGRHWVNHRLQARPVFAWLFVLSPRPGLPEFNRYASALRSPTIVVVAPELEGPVVARHGISQRAFIV